MIAALMRWRQTGYQTARRTAVWSDHLGFVDEVLGGFFGGTDVVLDREIGLALGRGLAGAAAARPADLLGDPAPLVTGGRSLPVDGGVEGVLAAGFGLADDVFHGDPVAVLGKVRGSEVLRPEADRSDADGRVREALRDALRREVERLVADVGAGVAAGGPDALDRLLEAEPGADADDEEVTR
jgi:hypothetical protein